MRASALKCCFYGVCCVRLYRITPRVYPAMRGKNHWATQSDGHVDSAWESRLVASVAFLADAFAGCMVRFFFEFLFFCSRSISESYRGAHRGNRCSFCCGVYSIYRMLCSYGGIDPFRTTVPSWGQTTWNLTGLRPQRDCCPRG